VRPKLSSSICTILNRSKPTRYTLELVLGRKYVKMPTTTLAILSFGVPCTRYLPYEIISVVDPNHLVTDLDSDPDPEPDPALLFSGF
jgi:hypothetical protein